MTLELKPTLKSKPKPKYLAAEPGHQRERWLISYTDFVTILLILFVAIAAQSLHPAVQPRSLRAEPQKTRPAPQTTTQDPGLMQADEKLRAQGVDARLEKRGLVISLPQAVLFPPGEDRVVPAAFPVVSKVAEVIASVPNKVALVGHADSVPIHNKRFQNNWQLSAARSVNLLELLSTRYGIDESRLSAQSYGSYEPKDSNDTPAGRAENRRVEILLLDASVQ